VNAHLSAFPFPFQDSHYRYSNNSIPLDPPVSFEITPSYLEEVDQKRKLLTESHERCFKAASHTLPAQWDVVELLLTQMAAFYPEHFQVDIRNESCFFHNRLTDEKLSFRLGDAASLPLAPLDFIGRHVQEDLIIMGQRDGALYLDAGQLCFPSNWSLYFNAGMSFQEIHSPIPRFSEQGLDDKIARFLMRIEAGKPWTRINWSLMAGNRLDTALETFDDWGKSRELVTPENAGELVHLRVEVQKLFRLTRSNSLLFTIHTKLLPLQELAQNKEWLARTHQVITELPAYIAEYKGIHAYKAAVIEYLRLQLER
jgi:hypothetical protein